MKWDTIKNRCVKEACYLMSLPHINMSILTVGTLLDPNKYENVKYLRDTTLGRALRKEMTEEIVKAIDNWDIRQYKTLQNVFPKLFPKNIVGIDLGEKGWVLYTNKDIQDFSI